MKAWLNPPSNDFYGLAKKVRTVPDSELTVAEAALTGGGPLAERFVAQLREAPSVWRRIEEDGTYELRVSTRIAVGGVPRRGWTSRPIPVRADPSGRALEVELYVSMASVIEIHGHTRDGKPWPAAWQVADETLAEIRAGAPWMDLPTPDQIRARQANDAAVIGAWLGDPQTLQNRPADIVAEPAASRGEIEAFERAEAFVLPPAYRDLLMAANGIEVGQLVVLGTNDAYRLDIPGPDRLVISPPDEDGACVLAPSGEVRHVDIADTTSDGRLLAKDLRAWVAATRPRARS